MLRCWDPRDAPLLKEATDSSLEHLRPWMAWAHAEPQPLAEKVGLLRRFRGRFDLGEEFVYGILDREEAEVVGGTGLHRRVDGEGLEIGYWIRASRVREGLATEVTAALSRVAFDVCGVDRVEVHVDPANEPSLGVPRKLGFREEATLARRLAAPGGGAPRDVTIFTVFAADEAAARLRRTPLEAFDAAGERVL